MAFLDGHYRIPALVIETINNLQRRAVVQLAIKNLKDLYPLVVKDSLEQIFIWLFYKHAPMLRHQGLPHDFIAHRLNTRLAPTETVDTPGDEPQNRLSMRDKMSHNRHGQEYFSKRRIQHNLLLKKPVSM